MRTSIRLLVLLLILSAVPLLAFAASSNSAQDTSQVAGCPACKPSGNQHSLAASYFNIRDFAADLILNNKGPKTLPVKATVFSLRGDELDLGTIELAPNTAQTLSLNQVLSGQSTRFWEGSLRLSYTTDGCSLVLSAGLLLQDRVAGIGFDELLSRPEQQASNKLAAVWWVPTSRSKMQLVLSNVSDEEVRAVFEIHSSGASARTRSLEASLGPHETRVLNVAQAFLISGMGKGEWQAGVITGGYEGMPGSLVAHGMIEDRVARYSAVFDLQDPGLNTSQELHGAGLRIVDTLGRKLIPVLVAHNSASSESLVSLKISYMTPRGLEETSLKQTLLEAGQTLDLSQELKSALESMPLDAETPVGLAARYSTSPGSVSMYTVAMSESGEETYRVPMIDPQSKGSAGNYPWTLKDGRSTFVFLKNTSDVPQQFTVQVDFDGGSYTLGLQTLQAGATFALDVRELRSLQKPDDNGSLIPANADHGQVQWSVIGPDNHSMIGRAEYEDEAGFASTFSCSNCCPDSYSSGWVSPGPTHQMAVGGDQLFQAFQQNVNCYGSLMTPFTREGEWCPSRVGVIVMVINLGHGESPGTVDVIVCVTVVVWYYGGPDYGCRSTVRGACWPTTVHVTPIVTVSGTHDKVPLDWSGVSGVQKSITLTATGSPPGGTYSWSTNSARVSLSNTTSPTVVVNSVSSSAAANDVTVTVTYTLNEQDATATKQLTVVRPFSLVTSATPFNPTGKNCSEFGLTCTSYLRTIEYIVKDQLGDTFGPWDFYAGEGFIDYTSNCEGVPMPTSQSALVSNSIGFVDGLALCTVSCPQCRSGSQGCQMTSTQTWFINGFEARNNRVTWICTDATVTPLP